jgi:hypothetical protein
MPRHFVAGGGVPSLASDGKGRLIAAFQWFPFDRPADFDRIATRTSSDSGKTWSDPARIQLARLPAGYIRPCDPTLVTMDDGRIRLYFTSHAPEMTSPATYSAVSSDGIRYSFEPGTRFAVHDEPVLDCAVARIGKMWHYFAPIQGQDGRAYHAESEDGLVFRRAADVDVPGRRAWLGTAVSLPRGIRFYGTGQGVWSAESLDGSKWNVNPGERSLGADPGVAKATNGRWFMVITGPPAAQGIQSLIPETPPPPPFP